MRKREQIAGVIGLLKKHYYGNISLLVIFLLLLLFRVVPLFTDSAPIGVTAERYAIVITLMAIPVTLKFFASRLKKLPRPLEIATASEQYKKAFFLRLYSISAVTLMHILLFGISRNMNFFWFAVVLFIVFFYCAPSSGELETLTEAPGEPETDREAPGEQIAEKTEKQQPDPKHPGERERLNQREHFNGREHPNEREYLNRRERPNERKHPGRRQGQSGEEKNGTEGTNSTAPIQNNNAENGPTTGK